jgi:hypothetical protein
MIERIVETDEKMMRPSLCLDHRPAQDVVYLMEEAGLTFSS